MQCLVCVKKAKGLTETLSKYSYICGAALTLMRGSKHGLFYDNGEHTLLLVFGIVGGAVRMC